MTGTNPQNPSPTVSAIIPAYNSAEYIHRAIESALAQTYPLLEIIVVDDGSKDTTADVVSKFPVTLLRKPNGGPGSARNLGMNHASGQWLAFLDADDTWHREKTELQLGYVRESISAVFCEKLPGRENISFTDMLQRNYCGNPSGAMIRRDVLQQMGGFDEDRDLIGVEDYNMWCRFILAGHKFVTTPEWYSYTPVTDNLSGNPLRMFHGEMINLTKIGTLANLSEDVIEAQKRRLRRKYIPAFIARRHLAEARRQLFHVGFNLEIASYWAAAFSPRWLLDMRRNARGVDQIGKP